MTNPRDYYFSTPIMSTVEPGEEGCERPTVIVTRKSIWDDQKELDYYVLSNSQAYSKVYDAIGCPPVMVEWEENFFQSNGRMTCDQLRAYLEQRGLTHNPALDEQLKDFLSKR